MESKIYSIFKNLETSKERNKNLLYFIFLVFFLIKA